MKRGPSQSQIINNFYTLGTIIIIAVVITLYSKYIAPKKEEKSVSKIIKPPCFDESFKLHSFNKKNIQNLYITLKKGYYKIKGGYIKNLNTQSYIEKYLPLDKVNGFFIDSIGRQPLKNIKKYLLIKYELMEKNKKFGTINISIRINGKEILGVFNTFNFNKLKIKKIVQCVLRTIKINGKQ